MKDGVRSHWDFLRMPMVHITDKEGCLKHHHCQESMAPSSALTDWARESTAPEGDINWAFLAVGNKAATLYPYYPAERLCANHHVWQQAKERKACT